MTRKNSVSAHPITSGQSSSNPRLLNDSGMAALNAGDGRAAAEFFAAAAVADPAEPALLVNLATACRSYGDDAGERAALLRVLDIDRRHFIAHLRLAELTERIGDDAGAAAEWSAVVQLAHHFEPPPPLVADAIARGNAFLARHNAALTARIDVALGDRLAELGSRARRMSACIDYSLGRRPIFRNECAGLYYPFLPADEFFDESHFPWFAALENQTEAIRNEAVALMANGSDAIRPYVRMDKGVPDNKWTPLDGSFDWSAAFLWEYGVRNDAVCDACPITAAALAAIPRAEIDGNAPSAFFSLLRPGAHIPPHTGVTNTRAIVHLPLVVPEGCRFRVGGETRVWEAGRAFAFDDTIEHEAWNDSALPRIVLILDVWNPHLTTDEQGMLRDYYAAIKSTA